MLMLYKGYCWYSLKYSGEDDGFEDDGFLE